MQESEDKIGSLRSRIRNFILKVISFAKLLPRDEVSRVLINQLLRSATSIGANFEESSEAESIKDIIHKMSIVMKETKETKYWLELIFESYPAINSATRQLIVESGELLRIFASIISKKKS